MFASPTANDDAGGPRVNPPGAEQSGQQTTSVGIDLISVDIFGAHVATMQLRSRMKEEGGKCTVHRFPASFLPTCIMLQLVQT